MDARRSHRFAWVALALCGVIVANIATFGWIEERYVTPSYRAFDPGAVPNMDPASQPSRWLRELAVRRYSLYLELGEVDGRTVVVADGVVPDPELLFGLARVDEVEPFDGDGASVAVGSSSCTFKAVGVDQRLGPYDLCLSEADRIVMFRSGDAVMVRDAED